MLRKLNKGEKALVLRQGCGHKMKTGEIITSLNEGSPVYCSGDSGRWTMPRDYLLAIRDRVKRGPDFGRDYDFVSSAPESSDIGIVTGFSGENTAINKSWDGSCVSVKWGGRDYPMRYRMNADYQDLKPTGDSAGDSKGDDGLMNAKEAEDTFYKLTKLQEPIQEDKKMTREKRAENKDAEIEGIEKAITDAKIAHKEDMAAKKEQIAGLKEEAKELRDSTTDKEALVKLVMKAKNLGGKVTPEDQAGAILALIDKEIEL